MKNNTGKKDRFVREWNEFIKSGDMKSLGLVYNSYFDLLYNYGRKFHIDGQLIEDAIQNVFINLIKSHHKLEAVENVTSYLFYSFRNELFRLASKEKNVSFEESAPHVFIYPDNNQEEEIIKGESQSKLTFILNKCIKKLTLSQQEILYMRYDANLSYESISRIINVSVESSRTAVYRAVKTLRKELQALKKKGVPLDFMSVLIFAIIRYFIKP
jgi:RNA polymerase sigma factor (sigma-70 family)